MIAPRFPFYPMPRPTRVIEAASGVFKLRADQEIRFPVMTWRHRQKAATSAAIGLGRGEANIINRGARETPFPASRYFAPSENYSLSLHMSSSPLTSGCHSIRWSSSTSFLGPGCFCNERGRIRAYSSKSRRGFPRAALGAVPDPLLVQAARGEGISRPPAWMMRQAGRYMAVYRKLAEKHPSFRERSETTDLIVEISLQPWKAFQPDGVIIFSDILTPLPAFGVPFDIEEVKGPVIQAPIRSEEGLKALHPINLEKLHFVGESLQILRKEVGEKAAVLGFVGAPWTIGTYIVEGGTTHTYTTIKGMCHTAPQVLRALLSHLTHAISDYIVFQINSGAQCIQIFDSWGGQLPPHMWELWSKPYIVEIVNVVKKKCPDTPLVLYINGNGGLLERMKGVGVDVIGLDWTVDMADGRRRLGSGVSVQGNVDPAYLFGPLPALTDEIHRVVECAGQRGHILNLGHGVLVGTPEEAVKHFFDVVRGMKDEIPQEAFAAEKLS